MKKIKNIILAFMLGIVLIQVTYANSADELCYWAYEGDFDMVKSLLAQGVNVNAKGMRGTALFCASGAGNLEMVKYLISKGANVNAKDNEGWTALMVAVMTSFDDKALPVIKYLVSQGADINARTANGQTALTIASLLNRQKAFKYLKSLVLKNK